METTFTILKTALDNGKITETHANNILAVKMDNNLIALFKMLKTLVEDKVITEDQANVIFG